MLYTRKGDGGMSGLYGTKKRFPKDSPVYEALGTVDELNSLLGACRAQVNDQENEISIQREIRKAQEILFIVQAELAGAPKCVSRSHIEALEQVVDHIEDTIPRPHAFVIPGGSELSAFLDYARSVARRTERTVLRAGSDIHLSPDSRAYLNRLSSLLYALARLASQRENVQEMSPSY